MSERRDIIHKALIRANAIDPKRLLDDEIDTSAAQLDFIIPPDAVPTDAQADEAVKRGLRVKAIAEEKRAKRLAEREARNRR